MTETVPPLIRALVTGEGHVLREVRLKALADSPDSFEETAAEAESRSDDYWTDLVDPVSVSDYAQLLVAETDEVVVSMAFVRVDNDRIAHVGSMWVHPSYRLSGIGQKMLDNATAFAQRVGAKSMELWVSAEDPGARQFYEADGYRLTGETRLLRRGLASRSSICAGSSEPNNEQLTTDAV